MLAHNFPIFKPIVMILVSKFMVHRVLSDKAYLSLGLLSPLSFKPDCLSSALSSICDDNFTCTWFSVSNSHFILDNCLLGYCHQSDVSN